MERKLRLTVVVESGCDVRLVEGLAGRFDLHMVCRSIVGGRHISWPPSREVQIVVGPPGRAAFAAFVTNQLLTRQPAPDVIVVQGYAAAALSANLAAFLRAIPSVMLVCSPVEAYYECRTSSGDPHKPFRSYELQGLRALARLNSLLGRHYIVLSRFLGTIVSGHGGRRSVDIVPVYGVDVERFAPTREDKALIRGRLGLPRDGKLLFFSSRIAPEKDSDAVLRAVRDLNRANRVWLLNRSGGYEAFLARARELDASGFVLAGGPIDPRLELPSYYQAADLCVQASREEGLGFSPLEALACGIPVVATDVGGLRETIIDGETGWSYPRGDSKRLAAVLAEVLNSPEEAAGRAAAGRRMVLERYAQERVFADFERVIRRIVSSRSAGRRPESRDDARGSEPDP